MFFEDNCNFCLYRQQNLPFDSCVLCKSKVWKTQRIDKKKFIFC